MSKNGNDPADALKAAGNVYSLVMENEHVRVLDARFKTGAQAVMHSHPNHVIYVLADGKFKSPGRMEKAWTLTSKQGRQSGCRPVSTLQRNLARAKPIIWLLN